LKYISVDKGVLYGVDSNDDIFIKDILNDWRLINGKLKQVQSSGNAVCGVTSNDQILCKDDL
jgi:predicted RNA-binding protein